MPAPWKPETARSPLALAFWAWYGGRDVPMMPPELYASVMAKLDDRPSHDESTCRYCTADKRRRQHALHCGDLKCAAFDHAPFMRPFEDPSPDV